MITIVYSTHRDEKYNKSFENHILESVGLPNVQVIEFINYNTHSLAQVYNYGIANSFYNIVVCCHNDIHLEKGWGKKLLEDFEKNPDYGIIGKAGSCYFPSSGVYWERMLQTMAGQVYHNPPEQKKWLSKYSAKFQFLIPVVTIDGLFISLDKTKIKHTFDESIGKFHFYDHSFCVPNYLDGIKIGVTSSFEITHQSVGAPNAEFFESKTKFLEKWGKSLPLDLKPKEVYVNHIKEKTLKNVGKVAIIIPTKGNTNILFECVKSYYDNCNSELFDIFIADTGSSNEDKEWIKKNILPLGNIKLIEYDYYNFAKINNDVVKNHIGENYEFLLFSNNDIKILNNVIYGMLKIFKENKNAGTVGCRLHFEDNTIQHNGVLAFIRNENRFEVSHINLGAYYNFDTSLKQVIGNTGGLMMVRKKIFEKCGLFNENYTECFEDVELNFKIRMLGLTNYNDGNLVAYHYESLTRNNEKNKNEKQSKDFFNHLLPFVITNLDKLKKDLLYR